MRSPMNGAWGFSLYFQCIFLQFVSQPKVLIDSESVITTICINHITRLEGEEEQLKEDEEAWSSEPLTMSSV
jgi:hypothetical protein